MAPKLLLVFQPVASIIFQWLTEMPGGSMTSTV